MHLSFILQNFSNSAKIRNISESLSSNSDGQCGGHLIVFYKALNGNSSELVRQRFDKSHLFEKQNRIAEHEERLYPSLTLTGDISSLGNLHRKKKFYRQREREKEREKERDAERQKSHIWDWSAGCNALIYYWCYFFSRETSWSLWESCPLLLTVRDTFSRNMMAHLQRNWN